MENFEIIPEVQIGNLIQLGNSEIKYRVIGRSNNLYKLVVYGDLDLPDISWYDADDETAEYSYGTYSNNETGAKYEGSGLETSMSYFYNSLSSDIQAAIVPQCISQNMWISEKQDLLEGSPIYYASAESSYKFSKANAVLRVGEEDETRYCYPLTVQDILDYLNATDIDTFENTKITKKALTKLFGISVLDSSKSYYISLLDIHKEFYGHRRVACVDLLNGTICNSKVSEYGVRVSVRPSFIIDLSKISYTTIPETHAINCITENLVADENNPQTISTDSEGVLKFYSKVTDYIVPYTAPEIDNVIAHYNRISDTECLITLSSVQDDININISGIKKIFNLVITNAKTSKAVCKFIDGESEVDPVINFASPGETEAISIKSGHLLLVGITSSEIIDKTGGISPGESDKDFIITADGTCTLLVK